MPPIVTRLEFPRSHGFVRFLAQVLWEADEQTFAEACAEAEAIYRKDGVTSTMLCAVMSLPVLDQSEALALLQTQPTFEQAASDAESDWQAIYEQATALSAKSGYSVSSISTSGSSDLYHSWLCSSTSSMLCALESQATERLRVSAAVLADVLKDDSAYDGRSGHVLAVSLCRTPTALTALRSLIWRIISQQPGRVLARIQNDTRFVLNLFWADSCEDLWACFVALVDQMDRIMILLDGVQRCGDPTGMRVLLSRIAGLVSRVEDEGVHGAMVNVFVTSRDKSFFADLDLDSGDGVDYEAE
ncbi:hypothetical protein AB5N19_13992 [Seiridium cardinale]